MVGTVVGKVRYQWLCRFSLSVYVSQLLSDNTFLY